MQKLNYILRITCRDFNESEIIFRTSFNSLTLTPNWYNHFVFTYFYEVHLRNKRGKNDDVINKHIWKRIKDR